MRDMTPLDAWLKVDTWHTFHPMDEERFYKAVHNVMLINTPCPEPQHVKEYILSKTVGDLEDEYLKSAVSQYVEKYDAVFSFIYENRVKL